MGKFSIYFLFLATTFTAHTVNAFSNESEANRRIATAQETVSENKNELRECDPPPLAGSASFSFSDWSKGKYDYNCE